MNDAGQMPQHIVIEGPIGVGKTSLARKLADTFGAELILEQAEENPFLPRFYRDPANAALSAQLYFLLQRSQQLQDRAGDDIFGTLRVADFMLDKDRLFAEVVLGAEEYKLYEQIYAHMSVDVPPPDLVIYLQAPAETLRERIQRRGIDYERNVSLKYLQQLGEAYTRFFHDYDRAPVLIVNTSAFNPVDSPRDYEDLLREIRQVRAGRHFFNPVSL